MKIRVNGEYQEIETPLKLAELLQKLKIADKGIAVEVNHQVVAKEKWAVTDLHDADSLEIVHFVGGGSF